MATDEENGMPTSWTWVLKRSRSCSTDEFGNDVPKIGTIQRNENSTIPWKEMAERATETTSAMWVLTRQHLMRSENFNTIPRKEMAERVHLVMH